MAGQSGGDARATGAVRVAWVDAAKGVGILLVIAGHVWWRPGPAHHVIYSFHMPLFFLLSGYMVTPQPGWALLAKQARSLLIPFAAFSLILIGIDLIVEQARGQVPIFAGLGAGIRAILWRTESLRAIIRARQGKPVELRRGGSHLWIHGLPFKLRFKQSKIYVSAIPVWGIGIVIGFIGAIMGIGGGFLLVPMLIYFLRVPTATVIGTSMVLTLITMASATVMHAVTNHLVDAILALVLMAGGVVGAQFGVHTGHKIRPERLRLMLGLLVFAVGVRFAYELVVTPDDLYSLRHVSSE